MRSTCLAALLVVACLLGGCRRRSNEEPSVSSIPKPGETFIIENERGELSGSVIMEEHAGVPRLTVDVRGD